MRKTYRYKDLSFSVADETPVEFRVELVSDGNQVQTLVNVPGPDDPEIEDNGTVSIGTGQKLRSDTTIVISDIMNLIPEENTITINYFVNDVLLVEHTNPKSDSERPFVILYIKFPAP